MVLLSFKLRFIGSVVIMGPASFLCEIQYVPNPGHKVLLLLFLLFQEAYLCQYKLAHFNIVSSINHLNDKNKPN